METWVLCTKVAGSSDCPSSFLTTNQNWYQRLLRSGLVCRMCLVVTAADLRRAKFWLTDRFAEDWPPTHPPPHNAQHIVHFHSVWYFISLFVLGFSDLHCTKPKRTVKDLPSFMALCPKQREVGVALNTRCILRHCFFSVKKNLQCKRLHLHGSEERCRKVFTVIYYYL